MKQIDGKTRVCGLLGNPVEHTMSPAIHNYLAEEMDYPLAYLPFHVDHGYVRDAVKGALAMNFLGLNVTVPYKTEVIPFLKEIDPLAETIGAVNTLVRVEGGFKGYNTDMPGLYRALCREGIGIKGERVLVLGAGGVARAVCVLLAQKEAKEIVLLNRTVSKAQMIADEVNSITGREIARALPLEGYESLPVSERYLAIQATSVGIHPNTEDVVISDKEFYDRIHTGFDLIYNPRETKFMRLLHEQNKPAYNGLTMLLYQGIIAYELWTQKTVSEELADKAYIRLEEALNKAAK